MVCHSSCCFTLALLHAIDMQTERNIRFVGLSTALANAQDLADWLGITGPVSARPIGL